MPQHGTPDVTPDTATLDPQPDTTPDAAPAPQPDTPDAAPLPPQHG